MRARGLGYKKQGTRFLSRLIGAFVLMAALVSSLSAWGEARTKAQLRDERLSYYASSYQEARTKFRKTHELLQNKGFDIWVGEKQLESSKDKDLYIDYVYLPPAKKSGKLLVLTSGIGGIDGFVGSAMQIFFLKEVLPTLNREALGVLVIHGINPYGMKHFRRVTEENTDLRHNFFATEAALQQGNNGYRHFHDYLAPQGKVQLSNFDDWFDYLQMGWKVTTGGLGSMRQTVLQGQHQYADGLFYGGTKAAANTQIMNEILAEVADQHEELFFIDFRTGFSDAGRLHLFRPTPLDPTVKSRLENLFAGHQLEFANGQKDYYQNSGDFGLYVENHRYRNKKPAVMVFDYGTIGSMSIMGTMKKLSILRRENQGFFHGFASDRDRAGVMLKFQDLYYPQSHEFRLDAIDKTDKVIRDAATRFARSSALDSTPRS